MKTYAQIQKRRWLRKTDSPESNPFRIMGIVEGWVVLRRPRAKPVVEAVSAFAEGGRYVPVEGAL